jgi:hypothetical protein
MAGSRFQIHRRTADRLDIELAGELDERIVLACEAEVRAQLSLAKAGGMSIAIDLLGLDGYSLAARDQLVALQRVLGDKAAQTAFVVRSSASRGLALWITHMVQGQVIKSFAQREDALSWLAGRVGPTTGVRPVLRARDRGPLFPRKRRAS